MRSIIVAISLACFATGGASAAEFRSGSPAAKARCPNDPSVHLARPDKGALHRKLVDLPPAEAYRAVYRRGADGCIVPVKFNERFGRPRRSPEPRRPR